MAFDPWFRASRAWLGRCIPGQCAICQAWSQGRLCTDCLVRFAAPAVRCPRCGERSTDPSRLCGRCALLPPLFDSAVAALDYLAPWSQVIPRLKFRGEVGLARPLADLLTAAVIRSAAALPDMVLPAPLSAERMRSRGFNQAHEIARRVAKDLGCKYDAALLLRMKNSPAQVGSALAERERNVRGVFAVDPLRLCELAGMSVAVVDDVMTSGATMAEIARILKRANCASVHAWAVARTPANHGP